MTAAARETLILTRSEIAGLMTTGDWLDAVETGFRAAAEGRAEGAPPMALEGSGGTFHAKGATIRLGPHYAALKLNGNFPDNPLRNGLPTIQGALLLCDGETGALLAVMDSIEVTLRRTAAATALAARYLARQDSRSILVCGCGEQGAAQLIALRPVLPLVRVTAWDRDFGRAEEFARRFRDDGIAAEAVRDLPADRPPFDVIVTATSARAPFLLRESVHAGTFVAAVGADSPGKSEIHPEAMRGAKVVADLLAQCVVMGDLHHAIAAGAIRLDEVHGELSELVAGAKPGRTSDHEVTIFDSTGTALQDVAAAATIYAKAAGNPGFRTVAFAGE
ncbi:MAG TPA: ornithine cyclodeaminase family protein [Sphingomicrobium sp.]|nr:ornithine cyclodeaminase family protein [Sphingomicrobium sp.]